MDETINQTEEAIMEIDNSEEDSIKMEKCCSECNCTGYDQDHDNICKCGHNSEKHSC
jgi:hypothetical protein